jgi:cytochrome c oxidase subunit 4
MASDAPVSLLGEGDAEGGAPRGHSEAMPHHKVRYFAVFYSLIVLTIVTVAVALFMHFQSEWYNVGIALLVATIKGALVAAFFMHLKYEGKLIWLALFFPVLLCIVLVTALIPDVGLGRETSFNDTLETYNHDVEVGK